MSDEKKLSDELEDDAGEELTGEEEEVLEEDLPDDFDDEDIDENVKSSADAKAERKALAREEYRRREMEHQQTVLNQRKKEEERAAKGGNAADDKKRAPVKEVRKEKKPGFFSRIGKWFKSLAGELKQVTWPSFKTVLKSTVVVLAVTGIFLVITMVMDGGLGWVYDWVTGKL